MIRNNLSASIINLHNQYQYLSGQVEKYYLSSVNVYRQFMKLVASIVRKIGLTNNSISYSWVLKQLIYEGYLSYNSLFAKTTEVKFIDFYGFLGIDVIRGYGCCRHLASIHQDVFDYLNMCGDMFVCTRNTISGHAVNLLEYDGMYYVHDLMGTGYYYFLNDKMFQQYNDFKGVLIYNKNISLVFCRSSIEEKLHCQQEFLNDSRRNIMTRVELADILNETMLCYQRSENILKDFKRESKTYIKKIIPRDTKVWNRMKYEKG